MTTKKLPKILYEPKILKEEYYGFNHKAVNKRFEGDLTFVNEFCVNDEYQPVAVYRAANPNLSKGHKRYILLQSNPTKGGLVRGMTEEEIEKYRYQEAVQCLNCNSIIYSIYRHHMTFCKCGNCSIDGGKDYTKIGFKENLPFKKVILDLLTDTWKDI